MAQDGTTATIRALLAEFAASERKMLRVKFARLASLSTPHTNSMATSFRMESKFMVMMLGFIHAVEDSAKKSLQMSAAIQCMSGKEGKEE
jgi:hypothetical protein